MIHPAIILGLFTLAAPAASTIRGASDDRAPRLLDGVDYAQLSIHDRIIIRLPRIFPSHSAPAAPSQSLWKERKGPKCVAADDMAGAAIAVPGSIDLMMADGDRLRAKLDRDCTAMDYYSGFYIRPAADGKVCADRDVIRARSGSSCRIEAFRTLVAAR